MHKSIIVIVLCAGLWHGVDSDCGIPTHRPSSGGKIVGGTEAQPYSWPWMGVLEERHYILVWYFKCGGTLIAPNWFLTAAQCVTSATATDFRVKLGVHRHGDSYASGEQIVQVKNKFIHPNYEHSSLKNNVALLELSNPVQMTDKIQPICLPANDSYIMTNGNPVVVTGWGTKTQSALLISKNLQQVTVPVVDQPTCRQNYQIIEPGMIFDSCFCAGEEGKDSCEGDSGDPVIQKTASGKYVQYGIVSWGHLCALDGYPGVSTRVKTSCDFIESVTQLNLCKY